MKYNNYFINIKRDYVKKPKGVIIFIHGVCEHLRKFDNMVRFLNTNSYSTIRYDQLGHGLSEGERGDVKNYNEYLSLLNEIIKITKEENKGQDIFIFAHSLGAITANIYALKNEHNLSGIITSGGVSGYVGRIKKYRFLSFLIPNNKTVKNRFIKHLLTHDDILEKNYRKDVIILKEYKIRLVKEMLLKACRYFLKNIKKITMPYLILHGLDDKLVEKELSINLLKKISSTDKTLKLIPNASHEIFTELNKTTYAYNYVITWLKKHTKEEL